MPFSRPFFQLICSQIAVERVKRRLIARFAPTPRCLTRVVACKRKQNAVCKQLDDDDIRALVNDRAIEKIGWRAASSAEMRIFSPFILINS